MMVMMVVVVMMMVMIVVMMLVVKVMVMVNSHLTMCAYYHQNGFYHDGDDGNGKVAPTYSYAIIINTRILQCLLSSKLLQPWMT